MSEVALVKRMPVLHKTDDDVIKCKQFPCHWPFVWDFVHISREALFIFDKYSFVFTQFCITSRKIQERNNWRVLWYDYFYLCYNLLHIDKHHYVWWLIDEAGWLSNGVVVRHWWYIRSSDDDNPHQADTCNDNGCFLRYCLFVIGINRSPVDFPHKRQ